MNNKRYAVLFFAVCLSAGCALLANTYTVTSDDGNLELRIAKSSVPKDFAAPTLRIATENAESLKIGADGEQALAIYDLQPDGLQLSSAAEFTLTAELPDENAVPVAYHLSGNTLERLETTVTKNGTTAMIEGEVSHFSRIVLLTDVFESYALQHPATALVGQSFDVKATITKKQVEQVIEITGGPGVTFSPELQGTQRGTLRYIDPWQLQGTLTTNPGDILAPKEISEAPKKTDVAPPAPQPGEIRLNDPPSTYTYTGTFTCVKSGKTQITYTAEINARSEVNWTTPNPPIALTPDKGPIKIKRQSEVECTKPAGGGDGDGDGDGDKKDGGGGNDSGGGNGNNDDAQKKDSKDCPDCEELQRKFWEQEMEKERLNGQIVSAETELKATEDDQDTLNTDIDRVIAEAGCDPNQNPAGATNPGESSGKTTSQNRDFFCPNERAAEAMTEALAKFWETHNSPSKAREKLRKLKEDLAAVEKELERLKNEMMNCPCPKEGGGMMMVQVGPPYLIICPDGSSLVGTAKVDVLGNQMTDAAGNIIDADTGVAVRCL